MSETKEKKGFFKRAFFYGVLQGKTHAQKIALVAVSSAFVVVANVFEFKMMDRNSRLRSPRPRSSAYCWAAYLGSSPRF